MQRAVTWKTLQIGPWLPLKLNRKSWVAGLESPLAWTSHDRKRSKRGPTEGPRYWDRDEVTVNDQ